MNQKANKGKMGTFRRACRFSILGVLLLGFTSGLWAEDPQITPEGAKGLYSAGNAVYIWTEHHQGVAVSGGTFSNGQFHEDYHHFWNIWTAGGLGGCVFDSAAYCFFIDTGGRLKYVKVNASNGKVLVSPKTIATGISQGGVAAAVIGGWIYVFTASHTFHSHDGKNFAAAYPPPDGADAILDAVSFYPPDGAPPLPDSKALGAIMVVYLDGDALRAELFQMPNFGFSGSPMDLPNPLSYPVARGNCILGTSKGFPSAGAKDPCIQFYGCSKWDYTNYYEYGRWEYNQKTGQWSAHKWKSGAVYIDPPGLAVAPWFETIDTTSGTMHLQHLVWDLSEDEWTPNDSDYQVPMYNDQHYGWAGKPTPTSSAPNGSDLQNLWTLVGVILGPPPYPLNGAADACGNNAFGWVDYGKDNTHTVGTTSTSSSTISVASETKITGGLGDAELDLSYAHGWTSSHGTSQTVEVSEDFQFGPCSEQSGSQGIHGWAIFNAPTLVTQRYKLYAYDYDHSDGSGAYLGQSVYTTSTGAIVQQMTYFELQDPSNGEYTGLFSGMPLYPNSTDIGSWNRSVPDWDGGGSDWTAIFGDTTSPQMPVVKLGGYDEAMYALSDTTISSNGNSNSFSVSAGGGLNIEGFSENITVGYDGEWTTTTDHESTITTSVTCGLDVLIPADDSPSDYIKSMTVQPFWLQAKTDNAPWVPTGYVGNLPWCITWAVTQYATVGGGAAGVAAAPASASGRVSWGKDHYVIDGGIMVWRDEDGIETSIPMTADEFDPNLGAAVRLNGYTFPADGSKGKWTRQGDQWKYKTGESVKKDPIVLKLDFATNTWSFDGKSKHLDQNIKTADCEVVVELDLNGVYGFFNRLRHDVDATWHHRLDRTLWEPYGVHLIEGAYDSQTGLGHLYFEGHIPEKATRFGDLEILVNGVSVSIPLLGTEGFLDKLYSYKTDSGTWKDNVLAHMDRGHSVEYTAEDLYFKIDFSTGAWQARIDEGLFDGEMAPKGGVMRIQMRVGGEELSDQTLTIEEYTTVLLFKG